jgi:nitrite reductase (NADH) large subunit
MNYAILGATVAGISAAKTIREFDPNGDVFVVSFEINPLGYYDREQMPQHLVRGAANPDDGLIEDAQSLAAQGIHLEYDLMEAVFPRSNQLLLNHGIRRSYDCLLLAMESTPMIHEAPGAHWIGVHQLRIYEDITWIENWIEQLQQYGAVIISQGVSTMDNDGKLGLEMCYALRSRGVDVTYVTQANHVGSPFLAKPIADCIQRKMESDGISVVTGQSVTAYHSDDEAVLDAVLLGDGRRIPTRMALSTVGVRPTIDVIEDQGINIDEESGAVVVNVQMQTNLPNIYAAGSVASLDEYIAHNSQQAAEQGRIAALNMLGQSATYTPFHGDLNTTLYNLPFGYFGEISLERWTWENGPTDYACVFLNDGGIQGVQLLGQAVAWSGRLIEAYQSGESVDRTQLQQMLLSSSPPTL